MADLYLNPATEDFELGDDMDLRQVEDAALVAQAVRQTLKTHRGEWMFDTSFGVPYRGQIFSRTPDLGVVEATIRAIVLGVAGVNSILELDVDHSAATRKLTVTVRVDTIYGPAEPVVI